MKSALFALICFLASTLGARAGTAYAALELVGKQHGEKVLDQVMEVRGVSGSPQPKEWVISVVDKDARGGLREFGVQGAKVTSERTPVGRGVSAPMNMNQLNLDSDGAQIVADREAKKAGFEYDYADYVLHAGTRGGAPVWELSLVDEKDGTVATLILAADKGTVLSAEGFDKARPAPPAPEEDPRRQVNGNQRPPGPQGRGNFFQRAGDSMNHFFDRVGNHLERRGRQIGDTFHNAFSGDRRNSAGPHHPGQDDEDVAPPPPVTGPAPAGPQPRPNRDPNGTDYSRPRD